MAPSGLVVIWRGDMGKVTGDRRVVFELAARPEGVGTSDFEKQDRDRMASACSNAVRNGLLYRGKGPKGQTRYFTDQQRAKDYEAACERKKLEEPVWVRPKWLERPAGGSNFKKLADVVYTPDTKVTICPPWKPRFHNVELPFVHSANQSGRVLGEVEA